LDPMGKCSNAFFSETTNMIKAKLYMNVHWTVLYNLKVFCSDRSRHFEFHIGTKNVKFVEDLPMNIHVQFGFNNICSFWEEGIWTFSHRDQWIHRLTLVPMGKCSNAFFSETTNTIKAKLYMNVHWMVLYKFYVFCSDSFILQRKLLPLIVFSGRH
jgi:hypothetical protein